jgi:hypothetical protein
LAENRGQSAQGDQLSPIERRTAWILFAILAVVRLIYVFRFRIDSDEPQHLHTVWNWTQGRIPYRDFFDNHTPLFHLLCSPLLRLVGERADALNLMRLAMLPLYAGVLWAVYRIGRRLFTKPVALWATLIAGTFPNYFFPSLEFRTDNLWAPLWLLAMMVFLEGRASLLRWCCAGLLIGTAFAVSMKTSVLVATLAGAGLLALPISPLLRRKPLRSVALIGAALLGAAVVPWALIAFLKSQGAYEQFRYCVIDHNILPAKIAPAHHRPSPVLFGLVAIALWFGARALFKKAPDPEIGTRRAVVFLQTGIFLAVMELLWPEMTRQDFLPAYPLAAMLLTPVLLAGADWVRQAKYPSLSRSATMGAMFAIEVVWLLIGRHITFNGTACEVHLLSDVLRLTEPGEYVMTFKGEAVFRPRPYFYVLEPFTRLRLYHKLLEDDIAERMIATRTCVAMTLTHRMPKKGEQFILENYVPVSQLRVVGKELGKVPEGGVVKFEVKVPAEYTLVSGDKPLQGATLDGTAFSASRMLEAGSHELRVGHSAKPATLIWSRAIERGFYPKPANYKPERVGSEF